MDFEGRYLLVENCEDFFEKSKEKFIKFTINICQGSKIYVDLYEVKSSFEAIYDSLLLKEPNYDELRENLLHSFKANEEFAKYVLTRVMLYILNLYSKNNQTTYLEYVLNAINRMVKYINKEDFEEKTTSYTSFKDSSVSSFEGSGGFIIRQTMSDIFNSIKEKNETLEFLNLYNGVPVKCEASIESIEQDGIIFSVNLMQILAMMQEGNAFIIQNSSLGNHIKADIVNYYFSNNTVKLNNFTRLKNMPATQREFVRVHPNIATNVTLTNQNQNSVKGILYDISEGGMGVVSTQNNGFKNGDIIKAEFELLMPHTNQKLKITQDLKLIILIDYQGSLRYCMQTLPNQETKVTITDFVKQREIDTLGDLKEQLKLYT